MSAMWARQHKIASMWLSARILFHIFFVLLFFSPANFPCPPRWKVYLCSRYRYRCRSFRRTRVLLSTQMLTRHRLRSEMFTQPQRLLVVDRGFTIENTRWNWTLQHPGITPRCELVSYHAMLAQRSASIALAPSSTDSTLHIECTIEATLLLCVCSRSCVLARAPSRLVLLRSERPQNPVPAITCLHHPHPPSSPYNKSPSLPHPQGLSPVLSPCLSPVLDLI